VSNKRFQKKIQPTSTSIQVHQNPVGKSYRHALALTPTPIYPDIEGFTFFKFALRQHVYYAPPQTPQGLLKDSSDSSRTPQDSLGLLHHSSKVPIQSSDTLRTPQGLLKEFINYRSKTL